MSDFKPYIFINTAPNLKRPDHFVRGLTDSSRYMWFVPALLNQLDPETHEQWIAIRIRHHYTVNNGRLPIWGSIRSYTYHYAPGKEAELSPEGALICSTGKRNEPQVSGRAGKREILQDNLNNRQ